jgi:hypothetical protein
MEIDGNANQDLIDEMGKWHYGTYISDNDDLQTYISDNGDLQVLRYN